MLLQILRNIDRKRFNSLLVLPAPGILKEKAEESGIEVKIIPYKWWLSEEWQVWKQPFSWLWNIKSIIRLLKFIKERQISLVFTNSVAVFSGAWAAKITKVGHIWSIHEILDGQERILHFWLGKRILIKLIDWLSTAIVVNSKASRRSFPNNKKVRLIYGGFELPQLSLASSQTIRRKLGLRQEDFVLGIVGKIYKGKGQEEVIQAVAYLKEHLPQVKLLIVGEVKDKRYYRKLKRITKKLGLEGKIKFTGYQHDIFSLLGAMDLLIVASRVDSLGLAALEAMAVSTPVLAVRAGGLSEIIKDGDNGFLVESNRPGILAEAVESLWRHPSRLKEASQRAISTLKDKFSLSRYILRIEQLLDEYGE